MENPDSSSSPSSLPENGRGITASTLNFPVIGIGASAGGLPALLRFFKAMPSDNDMAFIVILHLSPDYESNAAEILQGATSMEVSKVTERTPIAGNRVYVISPNEQLIMDNNHLGVTKLQHSAGTHASIDLFFRSLADVHKERAFGVVLSGAGTDGAVGLGRIKEQGGITMAQSPNDAEHEGMPRSAIEAGIVDFILPAHDMPAKLIQIWENAKTLHVPLVEESDNAVADEPAPMVSSQATESALQETLALLRRYTGHDFRHYKRGTVARRIERRMQVCAVPDFPSYRDFLKSHPEEGSSLLQDLLIGVTQFFRDQAAFEALQKEVMPLLFDKKGPRDRIRVWVTACSTGEEAYSLAMQLAEYSSMLTAPPDFQVFATDIDERAISVARAGLYPQAIEADVSPGCLRQFFAKEDRHYRIKKSIREKMLFAPHDLLRDSPFSKMDLISCRNLLIYLNRDVQLKLLELLHFALRPGGYLYLGSSETADAAEHLFTPVDKKNRIYQAKVLTHPGKSLPMLPLNHVMRAPFPEATEPASKPKFSYAKMHERVLAQFAPPSVIVDRDSNIVHVSDDAGIFLRYIGGEPSRNLPMLVLPQLRLELRTALFQAMQSNKSVQAPRIRLEREGHAYSVGIVAHPFRDSEANADFVLVVFNEIEEPAAGSATPSAQDGEDTVLAQLEEELHRTKEQLQQTMESAEISTEEWKASNEELQAINEELRSATEELETSKEELQSVNEELVTVNYEMKTKVEEANKVNDDLNNLIASTDIATVFVDAGMRIKRFTPAAANIFNLIAADIGRSLLDITHRLDYPGLADDAASTFGSLVPIEREVHSKDDKYYIARILPYRTTDDRIGGAVLTFIDITSRHRAEERVKAGERRIQLFAESTKDYAIITTNADGTITSWNKGAELIFGYAEEEAIGKNLGMICLPEDIQAGLPQEERRRAREEGRVEDERWYVRKDGSWLFCSGMLTPLQTNEFFGYAKILRDVTQRKEAERQREAEMSREKAVRQDVQAENELKDQFLAVMSHELKQPLNLIHLNAEMLMRLPEVRNSALAAKAAGIIQKTTLNQAQIIDDLLDLSRLSTGKLTLSLTDVDFSSVVRSIYEVAQPEAAASDLEISVSATEQPIIIRADPMRLEQMIWNLLNNAIKFTPAGGSIRLAVVHENESVRLDVIDTGRGITPEFLPHVFDVYRQAAPPTTRTTGGLGIGLSLVKQLANLHGGHVEAASDGPGKGARFSVWLPLSKTAATDGDQGSPVARSCIRGLRILLVDDVEEMVLMLRSLLEFEGATVLAATNGTSALEMLAENDFDLVMCDLAMPGMDGYEFIKEVRNRPQFHNLPVIAVTGLGRTTDVERSVQAGFSAHLSKPISIDAIAQKIADLGIRARKSEA